MSAKYGFLGSGKMASALARGFMKNGIVSSDSICMSAPSRTNFAPMEELGVATTHDNVDLVQRSTVVILAVKPQVLPAILSEVKTRITPGHLVLSIVAGVTTDQIEAELGDGTRVVRVVTNTPSAIGAGACAVCGGASSTEEDIDHTLQLMRHVGVVHRLPERMMDAVTGLAGSGPAFAFLFLEALADGGVQAGLPRAVAQSLATQTVMGAALLQQETGLHPGVLKDDVCSPAGTTITGVRHLEERGFRSAAMGAVTAAAERGAALRRAAAKPAASAVAAQAGGASGAATAAVVEAGSRGNEEEDAP